MFIIDHSFDSKSWQLHRWVGRHFASNILLKGLPKSLEDDGFTIYGHIFRPPGNLQPWYPESDHTHATSQHDMSSFLVALLQRLINNLITKEWNDETSTHVLLHIESYLYGLIITNRSSPKMPMEICFKKRISFHHLPAPKDRLIHPGAPPGRLPLPLWNVHVCDFTSNKQWARHLPQKVRLQFLTTRFQQKKHTHTHISVFLNEIMEFFGKKESTEDEAKKPPALAELLVISATAHAAFSRQALVEANSDLTGEEFPSTPVMDSPMPMTYLFMTYSYMIYSYIDLFMIFLLSVYDLLKVFVIFCWSIPCLVLFPVCLFKMPSNSTTWASTSEVASVEASRT